MAEKFSKFRDPGTGIQVFLTPVAASTSSSSSSPSSLGVVGLILTPIFILLGLLRSIIGGLFWGLYLLSGSGGLLRIVLFCLGFVTLPVETVSQGPSSRKKQTTSTTVAEEGDLVLSNHSSWIDLLLLAYLHPGIRFVAPVIADADRQDTSPAPAKDGGAGRRTPKKNAMSANTRIVTPSSPSTSSTSTPEIPILGYTILPLTTALGFVANLPPSVSQLSTTIHQDLDSAIKSSSTPLSLFPEVTTSNNRALLLTSLPPAKPASAKNCIITTVKYNPPTPTSTTSVYSVPSSKINHLGNILFLSSPVRSVALRQTVLPKEAAGGDWNEEVVGTMSSIARLKRTGLSWSLKKEFLSMIKGRSKRN